MEQLWIETAKQVPALAVLAYVVVSFLRAQRARDVEMLEHETKRDETLAHTLRHLGDDCHAVQRQSNEVMRDVAVELSAMREVQRETLAFMRSRESA